MTQLYDSDFYAWTQEQSQLLRAQKWQQLDVENLVEEIESLGRQERRELANRLAVLLGHLLKWQFQPEKRGNSWLATIRERRRQATILPQDNPSLKPKLAEILQTAYESGVDLAVRETDFAYETFPQTCPYTLQQILNFDSLPE